MKANYRQFFDGVVQFDGVFSNLNGFDNTFV